MKKSSVIRFYKYNWWPVATDIILMWGAIGKLICCKRSHGPTNVLAIIVEIFHWFDKNYSSIIKFIYLFSGEQSEHSIIFS